MKKKKKMKVENMRQGEEREEGENYDNDPEFAEILGSCLDDPQKVGPKKWFVLLIDGDDWMLRMRKKRNKILHTKTGSGTPMKVTFYKQFDHGTGRLGGRHSMNMQLSQCPLENRPSYDAIQGGHVNPTTFYNIGDLAVQDNLARIWWWILGPLNPCFWMF